MANSVVKDLDIFTFENSNVRAMVIDGNPWFVGKDVANILGYSQTAKAVREHVPNKFKGGVHDRHPWWKAKCHHY